MLATRVPHPFSDPGWLFEPKWDGIRLLVESDGTTMTLRTRSGRTIGYPEFEHVPAPHPVVLDGELIALDDSGLPSFELLGRGGTPVTYMVFDILYDGVEVIAEPLERRLERLASLRLPAPFVRSETVAADGEALFEAVEAKGMEGIVGKRLGSRYRPGVRSTDWLKIPIRRSLRAVIGGFTPGEGTRAATFGALLVGLWTGPRLRWIGAVGTGFDEAVLTSMREALDATRSDDCPFENDDELPAGASWVVPRIVAAIEYKEWTASGRLRGPSFKGLAPEPVDTITWEEEGPVTKPAS